MLHVMKTFWVTLMGVTASIGKGINYSYSGIGSDDGCLCFILFWLGVGLDFRDALVTRVNFVATMVVWQ